MTLEQIKFAIQLIKDFEEQKKGTCYETMHLLLDKTIYYFSEINFHIENVHTYTYWKEWFSQNDFILDCNLIISTLEGMLSKDKNYYIIKTILNDLF